VGCKAIPSSICINNIFTIHRPDGEIPNCWVGPADNDNSRVGSLSDDDNAGIRGVLREVRDFFGDFRDVFGLLADIRERAKTNRVLKSNLDIMGFGIGQSFRLIPN
jgi:hypothetical protein